MFRSILLLLLGLWYPQLLSSKLGVIGNGQSVGSHIVQHEDANVRLNDPNRQRGLLRVPLSFG